MEQALQFERELADIKVKQAAAEEQHKTIFRRLDQQDKLIEGVNALAVSVRDMKHAQETMQTQIDNMCGDVEEMKSKPAKRMEFIVTECIKLLLAAGVGAIITHLFG